MNDAVQAIQIAAIAALQSHPVLAQSLSGIYDGPPVRAVISDPREPAQMVLTCEEIR